MTRRAALAAAALAAAAVLAAGPAGATGFTDVGQDIEARAGTAFAATGALRLRGEALANLDLDRGTTPAGAPLFPVPLGDPGAQTLTHGDLRLRTDLAFFGPGAGVAVKVRLDLLDDVALGSAPAGTPIDTRAQRSPADAIRVKRAYGEALTPVGLFAAGRLGSHWGLGMLANAGDCLDCDAGDTADRAAWIAPLLGHLVAAAYDVSASGPFAPRVDGARVVDLDRADDSRSVTLAILRWRGDAARARRRQAGKATLDYGAYLSHRWQDRDVPAWYLPTAQPAPITPAAEMARGFRATAVDAWVRLTLPRARVEAEAALILGALDQPSLIPGVLLPDPVRSRQWGAAVESELGAPDAAFAGGVDLGVASGDPAPGFGAFPDLSGRAPRPGDLDGPQASAPGDHRVDNFRFHPDYRVDRILFREIIGTVTDAVYVRPHARWRSGALGAGTLTVALAVIASRALHADSTPGGAAPLGVEFDPTVAYESRDGFTLALEHAVLLPLSGLDNPATGQSARPAQLLRLRAVYLF